MNGHVLDTAQTHPSPSRTILEAPFVNVVDASEDDETDLLKHEYNSVVPSSHEPDATDVCAFCILFLNVFSNTVRGLGVPRI